MKPFLGIDLTENKKNDTPNGGQFVVARPSSVMKQALEASTGKAAEAAQRAKLPLVLRILQWTTGIVGGLIAVGTLRSLTEIPITVAYQNAPALFWIMGICLAIWAVLKLLSTLKEKSVLGSEDSERTFSSLESTCDAVFAEMGIGPKARDIDVLTFFYKVKDGNIKAVEKGLQSAPYTASVYKIYIDEENLYLMDLEAKYAFPHASIQAIRKVKKYIRVSGWNKEQAPNHEIYKPYKLTTDKYGCVHANTYYILEILHNGESWGIWFPCYELPVLEAATKKKAQ